MIQQPKKILGPYLPTIPKNDLSVALDFFLNLEIYERNTTCDWLNHTAQPIRNCDTLRFTKCWRKRQKIFVFFKNGC